MEKTTLYLSPGTLERLRARASREGRSQADIIRESVERYLADSDPLEGFAGAFEGSTAMPSGGEDLDAWLHSNWIKDLGSKLRGSEAEAG
ncbi:MAG: CopG family transcriptional regulator [Actinomycetota bacterium]